MDKVKALWAAVTGAWESLSRTQQVCLIVMALAYGAILVWCAGSGHWFLNPFNPVTWTGSYLTTRVFWGVCGGILGVAGFTFGMEMAK